MNDHQSWMAKSIRLAFAVILVIIGIALTVGGGWLIGLGGSPYYLLDGLATTASGVLVWRGDRRGKWLYAAFLVFTLGWAVWEAGLDGWALNARLLAPFVLGLGFVLPPVRQGLVRRDKRGPGRGWAMFVAGLFIAAVVGVALHPAPTPDPIFELGVAAPPVAGNDGVAASGRLAALRQ